MKALAVRATRVLSAALPLSVTPSAAALKPLALTCINHARSMSAGAGTIADAKSIIRFRDSSGDEHFGVFTDASETKARVAANRNGKMAITDEEVAIDVLLPPVDPLSIFCIGLNYIDHAKEVGMELPKFPVVFSKSINALTGHNSAIVLPKVARDEVDFEAELAVVIGRECKDVSEAAALDYVLGYTIANDVTARRWQGKKGGGQWVRSKSFDTFLPLGPCLVPRSDVPDPQNLRIRTWVNDRCVQDGNTNMMVFSVAQLISFLSQDTTLLPGTVILTGTPAGVGYVKQQYLKGGDVVRIEIERLGVLRNVVAEEISL